MKIHNFTVQKREISGKALTDLRAKGIVPGIVYGSELKTNLNVQMTQLAVDRLFEAAGWSSVVNLEIEGEKKPMEVLIKDVAYDPLHMNINHIDFYKIKPGEKIETVIELHFINESPAVKDLGGTLVTTLQELQVKCLPKDLIDKIEIDISVLKTFSDTIRVKDVKVPTGMDILNDLQSPVVNVVAPHVEEVEAKAPEAAMPEVAGEKKEAEGEVKADGKKEDAKGGKDEKKAPAKK